jgi:alkylation response protein AidB-like acyl-CoA dehydrogenase
MRKPTALATRASDGWVLHGTLDYVLDGPTADVIILLAALPEGAGVFAVETAQEAVGLVPLRTLDPTRRQAMVHLRGARAHHLKATDAAGAFARNLDLGAVALAAEQAGVARAALDMSVAYTKVREQFGKRLAEFQAVKHMCAEMLIKTENIASCARYAAVHVDNAQLTPAIASATKAYSSEAAVDVTAMNIQVHGGIGFTWEHPAHLFFKRAKSDHVLLGPPAAHELRLAETLIA